MLTASFAGVPSAHDGVSPFSFDLVFSEPASVGYTTLRDDSFTVTGGSVTGARRIDGRSDLWRITVAPDVPTLTDAVGDVSIELAATSDCDDTGAVCTADDAKALSNTATATVAAPPPLTAAFESVPAAHDTSTEFSFRLRFDTAVTTSYRILGGTAFDVAGGEVGDARRIDGRSDLWQITIQPDTVDDDTVDDDITITLPVTEDCTDADAVCTVALRPLSEPVTASVEGPLVEAEQSTEGGQRVTRGVPGDKEEEEFSLPQRGAIDETDATLSALTLVEGSNSVSLTPSFASGTREYQAWVANGVSSVTVTATKSDSGASVAITGDSGTSTPGSTAVLSLAEGANTITVTVTAADTTTTGTYTITAVREASAPTADPTALMTAKMTVAQDGTNDIYGYRPRGGTEGALTDSDFDYNGTTSTITRLFWNGPNGSPGFGFSRLVLCFSSLPADSVLDRLTLHVGSVDYSLADGIRHLIGLTPCFSWPRTVALAHGDVVTVKMFGNQVASGAPGVLGTAQVGQTLMVSTSGIVDLDGKTKADGGELGFAYGYQWIRVDSDGTNPVDISGATSVTYVPVKADVGKRVMVEVSFTDDRSNEEELTSAAYPAAGRILNDVLPMLDTATVNGVSLVLTYDRALDGDSDPAVGSYSVAVAGTAVTPTGVDANGRTVTLTLGTAVTSGQSVTLAYTVPAMNPVQDSDGTPAGAFNGQAVHNVVGDTTVPTLDSARVGGDVLVLSYSEALDSGSEPAVAQFDVQVTPSGGSASRRTVSTVDVSGSKVTLTLASAVLSSDSVAMAYVVPSSNPLQDVAGNDAAAFSGQSVGNAGNMTDATLSALTLVEGSNSVSLTPSFASGTREYQAWVANGVSSVTVTATKSDSGASVAITGDSGTSTPGSTAVLSLAEGANTITVTVTAADTTTTGTYTITAVREASAPTADPTALMTAKMTVAQDGTNDIYGYQPHGGTEGALTDSDFDYNGTTSTITRLFWNGPNGSPGFGLSRLVICFSSLPADSVLDRLTLHVGSVDYSLADGSRHLIGLTPCVSWPRTVALAHGDVVTVKMFGNQVASGAPGVSGTAQVGQTLMVSTSGIVDLDGKTKADGGESGFAYGYQWIRVDSDGTNPVDISGATSVTYVPVKADVGKRVMVEVSFTDDRSNEEELTSAAYPAAGRILNDVPPMLDTATVNGVSLVLTYDRELDGDSDPAASAYSVAVAGTAVTPTGVDADGRTVTLTLGTAVTSGQSVTLAYTVPTMNPVQDSDGTPAGAFNGQAVHNVVGDTTVPTLDSARVGGDVLVLSYSEALDSGSEPAVAQFDVQVTPSGGSASRRTVSTVDVSGSKVTLTLVSAVLSSDSVAMAYVVPSSNPLQDVAGNDAAAFSGQSVGNAGNMTDATLSALTLVEGSNSVSLTPSFASGTREYQAWVANGVSSVTVTATKSDSGASVAITGDSGTSTPGSTAVLSLAEGANTITVTVTAADTTTTGTYTITAVREASAPTADPTALMTAKMTVAQDGTNDIYGYQPHGGTEGALTDSDFDYNGTTSTITRLFWNGPNGSPGFGLSRLVICFSSLPADSVLDRLTLHVGSVDYSLADGSRHLIGLTPCVSWPRTVALAHGDVVTVKMFGNQVASGAPGVSGTAQVGQTLTVSTSGIVDLDGKTKADGGESGFAYGYQWIRVDSDGTNPVDISGATSVTYVPVKADVGKRVMVEVSFTDDRSNEEELTSAAYPAAGRILNDVPPMLDTATVNGVSLVLTYDRELDGDSDPAASAYSVAVAGTDVTPTGVDANGRTVTLTLGTAVTSGQSVTLAYTVPAMSPVQDSDGTPAGAFNGQAVHNVVGDTTAPTLLNAQVDGAVLVLSYSEALDSGSEPAVAQFDVQVTPSGGSASRRDVSTVDVSGSKVTLTLVSAVGLTDSVTLDYDKPSSNPLQDVAGNDAAELDDQGVNKLPMFAQATLTREITENSAANVNVGAVIPAATGGADGAMLVYSMEGTDAASFNFNVTTRQISTKTGVTYDYEDKRSYEVTIKVTDGTDNDTVTVTINLIDVAVEVTPPQLESATVNGTRLELGFSRTLDTGSVPSNRDFNVQVTPEGGVAARRSVTDVDISASTATLTLSSAVLPDDTVTVQYSGQALRDTTAIKVRAFDDEQVDNDTPDTTAPLLETHTVSGSTLTLTYNEALDESSMPAPGAFVVNVTPTGGTAQRRVVNAVVVDGQTVRLTLASPVAPGDTVTVVYTVPGSNPIQDLANNDAAAIDITIELLLDQTGVCNRAIQDSGRCDLSTATTLTPDVPLPAAVGERNDVDWFRVELVEGKVYRIDMEGAPTGKGTLRDPYLRGMYAVFTGSDERGYQADGSLDGGGDIETIWYSLHGDCAAGERSPSTDCELFDEGTYYNDDGGVGYNARLYLRDFPTGAHYVEARGLGPATGTYTITLTEVTDDAEGARPLVLSAQTSAVIDFPGDSDTFEIDLTAGTTYTITLRSQGWDGWSRIDIDTAHHNSIPGTRVDTPYDGSTGTYTITPATTGTHTLRIVGRNWGRHQRFATGDYTITIAG